MTHDPFPRTRRAQVLAIALGMALVGGCSSGPDLALHQGISEAGDASVAAAPEVLPEALPEAFPAATLEAKQPGMAPDMAASDMATSNLARGDGLIEPPPADIGQSTPQLVKQASLVLLLTDIDPAVDQVQTLIEQAKGDVLSLQDYRSPEGAAQQVALTLRVPQAELDPVLKALRLLGTVQQQSLTAEDISSQLVDLEARLKNLRQSEAALLKIMERSGEISHVLEVARELSTVRESIERMAAQQQNLKRQVAYAQISLTLQSPVAPVPPLRPVGETLGNTWQTATQTVKVFTVSGLKLGLWLLAFSPYWAMVAAAGYGGYRLWHRRPTPPVATDGEQG